MDLRKFLRYTSYHIIYDYLRYVIQAVAGQETTPVQRSGLGRRRVRDNYYVTPSSGPVAEVFKSLKRLPVAHRFDTHTTKKSIRGTNGSSPTELKTATTRSGLALGSPPPTTDALTSG